MATQRIMYVALADLVQRELGVWEARGGITGNPKFPRLLAEKQAVNRELWECTYAVRDTGLILAFEKPEDVVRRAEDNGSMNGQMYMRLAQVNVTGLVWRNLASIGPNVDFEYPVMLDGDVYVIWSGQIPQEAVIRYHYYRIPNME